MREYDLIADWYARERRDTTGVPETSALAAALATGAVVLDIGCGNGIPISRAVLSAGHRVVGLDTSGEMLARFRKTFPEVPAIRGDIRALPFADSVFDAAVAWGVLFHLPQDAQRSAIAGTARVLRPGAPFLFTAGDVEGAAPCTGTMNGVEFSYYSFSVEGYRTILAEHGLNLVDFHRDAGDNRYYLALKRR